MTISTALKWLAGAALAALGTLLGWLFWHSMKPEPLSGRAQAVVDLIHEHPASTASLAAGFAVLFSSVWLLAELAQRVHVLQNQLPYCRFLESKQLQPADLSIEKYHKYYHPRDEFSAAHHQLQTQAKLLILGRPTIGKTRMAFQLARELHGHWILILPSEFADWEKLRLPHIPWLHRLSVLWVVDNLDQYAGKVDLTWVDRALRHQCRLKVLVTCRKGDEFSAACSRAEVRSFLEGFARVECADFSDDEISSLARKVGENPDPTLYDRTPGSVTLGLREMKLRLATDAPHEQHCMRALHLLRHAHIFYPHVELVAEVMRVVYTVVLTRVQFEAMLAHLEQNDFLARVRSRVRPRHDIYLDTTFFPHYAPGDPSLEADLHQLGTIVCAYGDPWDLESLGIAWALKGDYKRAADLLTSAAEKLPTDALLFRNLGVLLHASGQPDRAVYSFLKALQLQPDDAQALNHLGSAYHDKGQFDSAIAAYQKALELEPGYTQALNGLGGAYAAKGQLDNAIANYQKAVEFQPDDPELLTNLGLALYYNGQPEEAIAAYQKSLQLKPDYPDAISNLGLALYYNGQPEEAIAYYRRALEVKPDFPEALNNLGVALTEKGQLDDGIASYKRALQHKTNYAEAHYNLGLALQRKGEHEAAQVEFAEAQRLNPNLKRPLEPKK